MSQKPRQKRSKQQRSKQRARRQPNSDHRCQMQVPAPSVAEIEEKIQALLRPENLSPLRLIQGKKKLRDRLLSLPVIIAIVISLVYRRLPGLSEAMRVLETEGCLWVKPLKVSKQALSRRLQSLPASAIAESLFQVIQSNQHRQTCLPIPQAWEPVWEKFTAVWIADGSTLEALKRKLKILRNKSQPLAGKMMMLVEVFTHQPVALWYSEDAKINDKTFTDQLLEKLPPGGLLIFDLGFFKFPWFDAFTEANKFFVTRLREKTAYQVTRTLACGLYFRDEIIDMGEYRSHPCKHPVRLVSVLWGKTWYYYLTNVLDPQMLSAQQVSELYRRRWRIEDAFKITKRLLGLAYLWVGDTNGVQIQLFATWIFYIVLSDLSAQVAVALNQPLERISVEMVFRGLYHFAQAYTQGEADEVVPYLAEHYKRLGLVKARRKRHRENAACSHQIWVLAA